jgi:predicted transcriptional regulator of viral defense system
MGHSAIMDAPKYTAPLSKREVGLIAGWERERRSIVSLKDIRASVGTKAATDVVRELVRKRALQRVRPGVYLVRPFRSLGRPSQTSTAVAAEALLRGEPHYLGGLWALSLHSLTEQRYASLLDAFVTHRLAARQLGAGRVRFHVLPKASFGYGITTTTIEGVDVHVSDVERTLLDAFDHPRLFGGIERALELARAHLSRVDRSKLLTYAVKGSRPSTCQRIGVLLEREGLSPRALSSLRARARQTKSRLSMKPNTPRTGRLNRVWNVVENDQ